MHFFYSFIELNIKLKNFTFNHKKRNFLHQRKLNRNAEKHEELSRCMSAQSDSVFPLKGFFFFLHSQHLKDVCLLKLIFIAK